MNIIESIIDEYITTYSSQNEKEVHEIYKGQYLTLFSKKENELEETLEFGNEEIVIFTLLVFVLETVGKTIIKEGYKLSKQTILKYLNRDNDKITKKLQLKKSNLSNDTVENLILLLKADLSIDNDKKNLLMEIKNMLVDNSKVGKVLKILQKLIPKENSVILLLSEYNQLSEQIVIGTMEYSNPMWRSLVSRILQLIDLECDKNTTNIL